MEHNTFDFTLDCRGDHNYPANYFLYDYFVDAAESKHRAYEIEEVKVQEALPGHWHVKFKLIVRDYGVAQVGMNLVGKFLHRVFEPVYASETEFAIHECVFYHTSGRGAKIDWDAINEKPIVERVDRESDQTEA